MASEGVVLRAIGVSKSFGGLKAVDGVSLDVRARTLTGIIGPNGAGKTTLFNLFAGFLRPDGGNIELLGQDVTALPAHSRNRLGLARTFQITRTLSRLTVLENLALAPPGQAGEAVLAPLFAYHRVAEEEKRVLREADEMLDFFSLGHLRNDYAGSLSGGQRKLLELARALMTRPRVVLLDEPMAGVNPTLAGKLMDRIDELRRDRGITFVLVEHDLETVFSRCDPIVVMATGRKLVEGDPATVRADRHVLEAYLGG